MTLDSTTNYVADRDGDGLPDKVYPCSTNCSWGNFGYVAALGPKPHLLLSATDGFGNNARFTYAPLSDSSVYTRGAGGGGSNRVLGGPMYVVKELKSNDGVGGNYTLAYKYDHAMSHAQGRGFLGFSHRTVTDSRTGIVTQEIYDQSINSSGTNWEFVGRLTNLKLRQSSSGPLLRETTYDWESIAPTGSPTSRYAYLAEQIVDDYELSGVKFRTTSTETTIDGYGTPHDVTTTIKENATGADTGLYPNSDSVRRTYTPLANIETDPSSTNWCLGKRTQVQDIRSHSLTDGGSITRITNQTWDSDHFKCRLTAQVVAPGTAWELTTTIGYDAFNNVATTTVIGSGVPTRTRETNWGSTGFRPEWTDDELDHRTTFE